MTPTLDVSPSADVVALLTARTRRGLQRLSATIGPVGARHEHVRTQLFLAPYEHANLKAISHTLAQHVGRPVAQALIVRLALRHLGEAAKRSLADPTVAARLTNDLMSVRSERVATTPSTPDHSPNT